MVNLVVILAVRVVEQCICQDLEVVLVVQQQQIKDMLVVQEELRHTVLFIMDQVVAVLDQQEQEIQIIHFQDLLVVVARHLL